MAQIINDPYAGSAWGQVGRTLGQGISEQIPKGVERATLAHGLRRLSTSQETDPFRQLASLYSIPGMTPEIAQQAQTYLNQQAQRVETEREQSRGTNAQNIRSYPGGGSVAQTTGTQGEPRRLLGTPQAIEQGALRYMKMYPMRYRTYDQAKQRYEEDVKNQEGQIKEVNSRFQNVGSQALQKGGPETYSSVMGEVQRLFEKRAEDAVLSGQMSGTEAADHYTAQMLDYAKARHKMQTKGPDRVKAFFSPTSAKAELNSYIQAADKAGVPKDVVMNDLIANQHLSPPRAAALAIPLSGKVSRYLSEVPMSKHIAEDSRAVFDQALNNMTQGDSLQHVALKLYKKGYSPQGFLEYAQQNGSSLTPAQSRETQNIGSFQPTLSDILYFTMTGRSE